MLARQRLIGEATEDRLRSDCSRQSRLIFVSAEDISLLGGKEFGLAPTEQTQSGRT